MCDINDPRYAPAIEWFTKAAHASREWDRIFCEALDKYGSHGPLISGCGRDHFPAHIKDELRRLASAVNTCNAKGNDCRPYRTRKETMRRIARHIVAIEGGGYYGYSPELIK